MPFRRLDDVGIFPRNPQVASRKRGQKGDGRDKWPPALCLRKRAAHEKAPALQGRSEWRDPDSNRGHHDFQLCSGCVWIRLVCRTFSSLRVDLARPDFPGFCGRLPCVTADAGVRRPFRGCAPRTNARRPLRLGCGRCRTRANGLGGARSRGLGPAGFRFATSERQHAAVRSVRSPVVRSEQLASLGEGGRLQRHRSTRRHEYRSGAEGVRWACAGRHPSACGRGSRGPRGEGLGSC